MSTSIASAVTEPSSPNQTRWAANWSATSGRLSCAVGTKGYYVPDVNEERLKTLEEKLAEQSRKMGEADPSSCSRPLSEACTPK